MPQTKRAPQQATAFLGCITTSQEKAVAQAARKRLGLLADDLLESIDQLQQRGSCLFHGASPVGMGSVYLRLTRCPRLKCRLIRSALQGAIHRNLNHEPFRQPSP